MTGALFLLLIFHCIYTVCLSEDVTGHCFIPACSTKVLFFLVSWIRSFTFDLFRDYFSLLIAQCICPKTWQVLCLLPHSGSDHSHSAFWLFSALFCTSLSVFGLLHCYLSQSPFFSYLCWLHSVSVQRRDRCIVTYSPHSVPFIDPLRFWFALLHFFVPLFSPRLPLLFC